MSKHDFTEEDDALLKELGITVESKPETGLTPLEERVVNGFQDIVRFCDENGRAPTLDNGENIFEKTYAIRLGKIRESQKYRELLSEYDKYGLLKIDDTEAHQIESLSDDELLDELGIDVSDTKSITNLKFVKPKVSIDAADQIASRTPSPDFNEFKPLFLKVKEDLKQGLRQSTKYKDDATILQGDLFIVGGQIAYIADMGPEFTNSYGRQDSRMRVVFDNGTHTEGMLMRSFQRALNKDGNARRIEPFAVVSLFAEDFEDGDLESGTIYVLRSKSNHPLVVEHRDIVHKIGVTGGDVAKRVANAKYDSTFLMADVEIVAEYSLANINRVKLESLIHKFFSQVQLSIQVQDRFGKTVTVKEWFLAPLFVIDQMIQKLKAGKLSEYFYDKDTASIKRVS
jgi:hypothetical protein